MGFEGWSAAHVPTDGYDLVAFDEIGALRVQVKSGFPREEREGRSRCYHFNNGSGGKKQLRHDQYDIICHCSLFKRRCIFYAASSINKTSQRYNLSAFDDVHKEMDSWQKAVQIVREGFC
jgi:hypothetical protein